MFVPVLQKTGQGLFSEFSSNKHRFSLKHLSVNLDIFEFVVNFRNYLSERPRFTASNYQFFYYAGNIDNKCLVHMCKKLVIVYFQNLLLSKGDFDQKHFSVNLVIFVIIINL